MRVLGLYTIIPKIWLTIHGTKLELSFIGTLPVGMNIVQAVILDYEVLCVNAVGYLLQMIYLNRSAPQKWGYILLQKGRLLPWQLARILHSRTAGS